MAFEVETNQKISWLSMSGAEVENEGLQKLFQKAKESLGFIPNVFLGFTIRPTHFRPWFDHFRVLMQGESELSEAEREMIGLVVSSENRCLYCLASHGAELRIKSGDITLADRLTFDYLRAGLDPKTKGMLDYALKITKTPVDCHEGDIIELRELGFSDEAIFDIAEVTAMFNFTNRLASATGMQPNEEYFTLGR